MKDVCPFITLPVRGWDSQKINHFKSKSNLNRLSSHVFKIFTLGLTKGPVDGRYQMAFSGVISPVPTHNLKVCLSNNFLLDESIVTICLWKGTY